MVSSYSCTMLERGSALSSSMFALIGLLELGFVLARFLY